MSWKPAPWLAAVGQVPSFGPTRIRERKRKVNAISVTRGVRLREYAKIKRAWLARPENKTCRLCSRMTDDLHHARGRTGPLLTDSRYFIPLCRKHHDWVKDNPEEARKAGVLAERGQWGKAEA